MKRNNLFKKSVYKIGNFFTHLPLFAKYLTIMTSLMLVSYLMLASALTVFLSSKWTKETQTLLTTNVVQNAEYCEDLLSKCETPADMQNAYIIICNNLGITSTAIDADVFFCNTQGEVLLCKEDFEFGYSPDAGNCPIHREFELSDELIKKACVTPIVTKEKVNSIMDEKVYIVSNPVFVNNEIEGIVFAIKPVETGLKEYTTKMAGMYLSSALFAAALSFIVIYAFTARLTRPLRQMSNAAKAYAKGDFSKRVQVRGSDELAELCKSFNQMATGLSVLESSRRSFVANVSHELKTPMTTIGGFIDGMLDGTIPEEQHQEYLGIVSNEVKRLSRLVTSMLNLSKIEAGELSLKYSEFDITQLLLNCMLTFEQEIEKKQINILGFDTVKPTMVYADVDMIYQVVYNLIDNAVKFTQEQGEITVSVEKKKSGDAVVSIKNTGEGIDSEEISRIFERFYKVDKSRSYDVKSAGLGLYLCKTIIDMHNGKIYAESEKGHYAKFSVELSTEPKKQNKP